MPDTKFLQGGGEMGALTRSFNWAVTSLGVPENWPQSLKTTLSIILNSRFPMFLWWGPQLLCFYNDAYRPSLGNDGKHPSILGLPAAEAWPEIWGVIKPLIDQVLSGGDSTWSEDQLIPIFRNAKMEDVYWTFSYSRVTDESGDAAGVVVTCIETTEKFISLKTINDSKEDLEFALNVADMGIWDLNPATNRFKGNHRLKEWLGLESEDEIPLPWAISAIAAKDRLRVSAAIERAMQYDSGGGYLIDYTIINPRNGRERLVRAVGQALFDGSQAVYRFSGTLQDITIENNTRKAFEYTYQRLEIALDAGKLGSYDVELSTGKMICSDQCKTNYGWPKDEPFTFHDQLNLIEPDYRDYVDQQIQKAITQQNVYHAEYPITWPNGSKHWMSVSGIPHYDENGKAIRMVGVSSDITERKQDDQRKNDFIGMVSHELKTPLTSLKGYIQILHAKAQKQDDNFTTVALGKAVKQVDKMGSMINSFLNISRLESGKIELIKQQFNLDELVKEVIEETMLVSLGSKITLSACGTVNVYADRDKIEHVISNLLSNAIKYSPKNSPVNVKCELEGEVARLSITDEGIGIRPNDIEQLFDRYYRVDSPNTKHISGFGIGLYLSAEIVQRHGGKIWVESEFEKGSTFYFTLPTGIK